MEISVAVDKLNSMTPQEIVQEAWYLPCKHMKKDAYNCLIANLLRYWGVEAPTAGSLLLGDWNGEVETPFHVVTIIQDFDHMEYDEFARKYL